MGPVISAESRARIEQLIDKAIREGARPIVDGRNPDIPKYRKGHFVAPTVLEDLPVESEVARTEIFGPVLSVHHVEDIDRGDRAGQHRSVRQPGLSLHDQRRERPQVPLRSGGRQRRDQRRRRGADGVLPVQRRARELLRRSARPGPRRVRVLHPGEGRRRTLAQGVDAEVLARRVTARCRSSSPSCRTPPRSGPARAARSSTPSGRRTARGSRRRRSAG